MMMDCGIGVCGLWGLEVLIVEWFVSVLGRMDDFVCHRVRGEGVGSLAPLRLAFPPPHILMILVNQD